MPATSELFAQDAYLAQCESRIVEISEGGIILEQTVFYPEGGGQVGDTGTLAELGVLDTQRGEGSILHLVASPQGLAVGQSVHAAIDWPRRYVIMRHHTLLHLCHIAASALIGEEPPLIGSQVREEKARLDYDYHGELDAAQLRGAVAELIGADLPVTTEPVPDGAPLERRWVIPGHAPIPCGGTHVRRTSEVGEIAVKVQRKGRQGTRVYCNVLARQAAPGI